jgi:hypothetical protein
LIFNKNKNKRAQGCLCKQKRAKGARVLKQQQGACVNKSEQMFSKNKNAKAKTNKK